MTVPADFGLVAGSRQLGKRLKRAEGQAVQRHWLIDGVPREVTTDQLVTVLQGAGFDEIEMLVQRRRGALMEFHFRAKATFTTDCIGIPFQLGENEFALWARIAPPKRGKGTPQTISTAGSWSLEPPKSRWTTEQVALNEGEDQETNGKDGASVLDSGSTAGDVTMPPGAADKDRPAGPVGAKERRAGEKGAAKKIMAVQQRSVPAGVEVAAQPMDGNCLLHCLAAGLKELDTPKEYTAAEIRARVANHFAKNESEYRKIWDGELPNHAVSDDFKRYVREVEKDGVWGGLLELRAAARIYDTRLIIFATPVEIEPFHVHGQQKRRVIALRFNGRHYDLLRGVGGKLPKDILEIKGRPEELAGWELQPQFACELAALREAVRLQSRLPPWLEDASVRLATKKWPALLPVTTAVLADLGWQWDRRGRYIIRCDCYGQERRFELGVDSFDILSEWLRDAHRRRMLARCGRVVDSLHRADGGDELAQGLSLPPPPVGTLAVFDGHKEVWRKATNTIARQSALVTGCSVWHKGKRITREARQALRCFCGRREPSR